MLLLLQFLTTELQVPLTGIGLKYLFDVKYTEITEVNLSAFVY